MPFRPAFPRRFLLLLSLPLPSNPANPYYRVFSLLLQIDNLHVRSLDDQVLPIPFPLYYRVLDLLDPAFASPCYQCSAPSGLPTTHVLRNPMDLPSIPNSLHTYASRAV
ncbi:uncharacterized protein SCHCODRAFT_02619052 [Schizophyllum commune H4-8]|uniref:uncharacterized protein n=1 Tax=Schizophyllum commune (strain H4-8 / FGSC 9210) TaxID=578458 RepID=UPI00215E8180|nr:uncharacterized protein SCHCODRAFT_02619052 [Schizophyllum commune H4-8]KAI5895307.1 hypothetical protein SCHCODRAFT_02619052 [Schizophyllum commune H4-8]